MLLLYTGTVVNELFPAWLYFGRLFASTLFVITELKGVLKRLMSSKWSNEQRSPVCMQMLEVLCHVLGSISSLDTSKTPAPSILCAEALSQGLVRLLGLPIATTGLWAWVWGRRDIRDYQPLRFHLELPYIRKAFCLLLIKTSYESQGIAKFWKLLHYCLCWPLSWSNDLSSCKHWACSACVTEPASLAGAGRD